MKTVVEVLFFFSSILVFISALGLWRFRDTASRFHVGNMASVLAMTIALTAMSLHKRQWPFVEAREWIWLLLVLILSPLVGQRVLSYLRTIKDK